LLIGNYTGRCAGSGDLEFGDQMPLSVAEIMLEGTSKNPVF